MQSPLVRVARLDWMPQQQAVQTPYSAPLQQQAVVGVGITLMLPGVTAVQVEAVVVLHLAALETHHPQVHLKVVTEVPAVHQAAALMLAAAGEQLPLVTHIEAAHQ